MIAFLSRKNVLGVLFGLVVAVLLSGTLCIMVVQSRRDFAGKNVRSAETVIRVLSKKGGEAKVQLNEILNPTALRSRAEISSVFSDVADRQIIRVRVAKRPIVGVKAPTSPRAEAIELAMATSRFSKSE